MSTERKRASLRELQYEHDQNNNPAPLQNLIRAFRGIQKLKPNYDLPPEEDLSFFRIAGFHGEPFEGPGKYDPNWWGGYCHHGDVLFPAWHRAYILHLENALRTIEGYGDVTLPFWDETWDALNGKSGDPIPSILTTPEYPLDGETYNPLYSYKLQTALAEDVTGRDHHRYSKPVGYETVRYPLSGLVGTPEDREKTKVHNERFADQSLRTTILNANVKQWLSGEVVIDKSHDDPKKPPRYPDTYSVLSRFEACLNAPTYTSFSNITSMKHYQEQHKSNPEDLVSIESPHNAIHLAVGGFFQAGVYNADPKNEYNVGTGANGDMGDNETAAFDPIFFLHHCFIDYVFWLWQKKHSMTSTGQLTIDSTDPGARSQDGSVGFAPNTLLETDSPLVPFKDSKGKWRTLEQITDISKLGYSYGAGSLDRFVDAGPVTHAPGPEAANFTVFKATEAVDRSIYPGSFVIRTYATTPKRGKVEIGREPVLSRWNIQGCKNCMGRLMARGVTPISKELEKALLEGEEEGTKIGYHAHVQRRVFSKEQNGWTMLGEGDRIEVSDL
jgi:tyrosinase